MPKWELLPRANYVIVGREEVDPFVKNASGDYVIGLNGQRMEKAIDDIRFEEVRNIFATVFSFDAGAPAEFTKGMRCIIEPSVFVPVNLDDGDRVWLGPIAGVKAFFKEVPDEQSAEA